MDSTHRPGYRLWFVCFLFLLFCCCVVAGCVAALFFLDHQEDTREGFQDPAKISKTPQRYSRPREDLENSREVHQDPREYTQDPAENLQEFREDSFCLGVEIGGGIKQKSADPVGV